MGGGGWVAGSNETKANSAQFQVKLPTGAELGNILESIHPSIEQHQIGVHTIFQQFVQPPCPINYWQNAVGFI